MSDKPKTPEEFSDKWCPTIKRKVFTVDLHLGAPQQYEEIKDPEIDDIIHSTWNAAVEVTRAEYEEKIKSMQAEIGRLKAEILAEGAK